MSKVFEKVMRASRRTEGRAWAGNGYQGGSVLNRPCKSPEARATAETGESRAMRLEQGTPTAGPHGPPL